MTAIAMNHNNNNERAYQNSTTVNALSICCVQRENFCYSFTIWKFPSVLL